ncbi:MAG: hypothetical protein NTW16_06675 [Bacteroidetes bacterium]|nr:hypothetical protein [Bacteroidota bacterium]
MMKHIPTGIRRTRLIRLSTGISILCLMTIMTFFGCKKDFDFSKVKDLSWNPDFAVPVVHDSITLEKVLTYGDNGDHLYIDESGNISILYYYNNDAFRLRPNDLIKLSPVSYSFLHEVTQTEQDILALTDLTTPPVAFSFNLAGNNVGMRVDELRVRSGEIKVTTNHTFTNDGHLTVTFLNATKNNLPFSFTINHFVNGQADTNISLADVAFDLSSSPNTINAEVVGFLKKSGAPVAGDEIRTKFEVSVDTIGRFEGFLGHQTLTQLMDTVGVNVFNNAFALGDVYFMDPQASITIVNSIGFPAEITVERLWAINKASGVRLDIADRLGSGSVFSVPSPLISATQPAIKAMNYNNDNTGNAMNDFFNLKPDNVVFQIKTDINPTGTPLNFFSDTSSFYADLRVKLPLWGHFDHLTFQDTFDLAIEKPEEIEHLEFRSNMVNGWPLTALLQIYFTDGNYNKLDSLTGDDHLLVMGAPVDPSTYLPYPGVYGTKDTTFILDNQRMQNLLHVKKILVKGVLHSTDEGQINVKLKADQMIKVNFSAKAKLRKSLQTSK